MFLLSCLKTVISSNKKIILWEEVIKKQSVVRFQKALLENQDRQDQRKKLQRKVNNIDV
jgi:hypothetical protein